MSYVDPFKIIDRYAGQTPVPIFDILADLELGPERRELPDEISGWIERKPNGRYWIVINSRHSMNRQRFTAAHELAHFVYHRDLLGDGVGDNRAYRADGTPLLNERIQLRHERQANSVAANILMPREAIRRVQAVGTREIHVLAERFGVSDEAMRIRLGHPR
jgi:Zn-dependent peptidase ImmA (M78 family)